MDMTEEELEEAYRFAVVYQKLSPTKKAILGMLASGFTNQAIADILIMGNPTCRAHISQIYDCFSIDKVKYDLRAYCTVMYTRLFTFELVRQLPAREYKLESSAGRARRFEDVTRYKQEVVL